jgi:hypothetical protein
MRSLCKWMAEKLYPQAFADQRSYERMKAEAIDAYHWLAGYPDASDVLRWLLDGDINWNRDIGEGSVGKLPSSIGQFRDYLESRSLNPTPAPREGTPR